MILWKLVVFIKILILGLRIFKSQNLLFFSELRIFSLFRNTLGKMIIFEQKEKKDSKSPPKSTSRMKRYKLLFSRQLFLRRHCTHTRIHGTFYRRERYNTYCKKKWYIPGNSSSCVKWKLSNIFKLKLEMLGRKKFKELYSAAGSKQNFWKTQNKKRIKCWADQESCGYFSWKIAQVKIRIRSSMGLVGIGAFFLENTKY